MPTYDVVREYVEPFAEVVINDRIDKKQVRRASRRTLEMPHKRFVWEFLAEVLRYSVLYLLVLALILGLERWPISLAVNAFHTPDSVIFLIKAIIKAAIGINVLLFVVSLGRSLIRVIHRA